MNHFFDTQKGIVAIFFAIVVAFITVTLSTGIGLIGMREIQFTALSEDSQQAFYAADSGAECAIFHDIKHTAFPADNTRSPQVIQCFNADILPQVLAANDTAATSTFTTTFPNSNICAEVTVAKYLNSSGQTETSIEARGRNTCAPGVRRVERGIQAVYLSS